MEPFYLIVLAIATIILILLLTFIGLMMNKKNKSTDIFPPVSNTCPDGWTYDKTNNACLFGTKNDFKTGLTNKGYKTNGDVNAVADLQAAIHSIDSTGHLINYPTITQGDITGIKLDPLDGSTPKWTVNGLSSICAQKSWANQNGILWDGVSNYNSCAS